MGQAIGKGHRFGTSTSVDERHQPTTSQQLPSRDGGARVPLFRQIFLQVCRRMRNGRGRRSRNPRIEVSPLPNAAPTEGNAIPHGIQALPHVTSSSSGLHPNTSAGEYDPFRHTYSLSMTDTAALQ